jgi:Fic family protein
VPQLVVELLARLASWNGDLIEMAAWALWRLNWIHPFEEGNGRTARAVTYVTICAGIGQGLPGTPTFLERLIMHKLQYNRALEAADAAALRGTEDVTQLASLLRGLVEAQLGGTEPG